MASSVVSHCSPMCALAKDAACDCAITGSDPYLPVPTMRRDAKVRPAMTKRVSCIR